MVSSLVHMASAREPNWITLSPRSARCPGSVRGRVRQRAERSNVRLAQSVRELVTGNAAQR